MSSPYPPPPQQPYSPQPGYGQTPPPNTYLAQAIASTLLCCLPAGIVGIVYASQVTSKWQMGDFAGARDSSDKAKMWSIISIVAGLLVGVAYLFLMGGLASVSYSR